jgi:hypothetical protein
MLFADQPRLRVGADQVHGATLDNVFRPAACSLQPTPADVFVPNLELCSSAADLKYIADNLHPPRGTRDNRRSFSRDRGRPFGA